ncbi:MAG: HAD hydrolase-like protein [Gemmatimonadota bacterium]|nr:HAD hydrolase-like protein [Gemmatimonadota bacterium]
MSGRVPPGSLLTFDCYGTLIDWERGILRALRDAHPSLARLPDQALLASFHEAQNELKTGEYRSYRELLTRTTRRVASGRSDLDPARDVRVAASIPEWEPFPDTNDALERLAEAGMTLGILSNIDDDLLAATLEHFTVSFSRLGTAERLRSYKPASAHFELGRAWARDHPAWLHVAQSLFHDVIPASRLDVPVLWVNRKAEPRPEDVRPVHVAPDLSGAADWILGA